MTTAAQDIDHISAIGTEDGAAATVDFTWPPVGPDQEAAVLACLRQGDPSIPARIIAELETAVSAFLGVPHVLAHGNGTSAMLSALHAVGVGSGDEVICPAYTWWASIAPVRWLGGVPVFCDIEPGDLTLDVASLEALIGPRTRAIVVPHLWGAAADVAAVLRLARSHGLAVVEDASQVFAATLDGRWLGTFGDVGVFSMQAKKPLPAGEGGLLVTRSPELYERALAIGHYERLKPIPIHDDYWTTGLGLKFRISALNAALALSHLPTTEAVLARQETLTKALVDALLGGRPDRRAVGFQPGVVHGGRTALRLVLEGPRACRSGLGDLASRLTAAGLPTQDEYLRPLHLAPLFAPADGTAPDRLAVTEMLHPRLLQVVLPVTGSVAAVEELGQAACAVLDRWESEVPG
ncbi:MAG: aminotransferase class I/II-fold pyridoxal phosphate-dependent enzyme [Catenulispora sp.]|nr:aminotransferase class I/II-fold pyridoxal phosphate-dependent enzyme [Catenulispora sp.]